MRQRKRRGGEKPSCQSAVILLSHREPASAHSTTAGCKSTRNCFTRAERCTQIQTRDLTRNVEQVRILSAATLFPALTPGSSHWSAGRQVKRVITCHHGVRQTTGHIAPVHGNLIVPGCLPLLSTPADKNTGSCRKEMIKVFAFLRLRTCVCPGFDPSLAFMADGSVFSSSGRKWNTPMGLWEGLGGAGTHWSSAHMCVSVCVGAGVWFFFYFSWNDCDIGI